MVRGDHIGMHTWRYTFVGGSQALLLIGKKYLGESTEPDILAFFKPQNCPVSDRLLCKASESDHFSGD